MTVSEPRGPAPLLPAFGVAAPLLPPPRPDLGSLRQTLLEQLGRAATAGVIDVMDPVFPQAAPDDAARPVNGPAAHFDLDGLPGIAGFPVNTARPALMPNGDPCLPPGALDISDWADDRPFDVQITEVRQRLIGEFDRPDAVAVDDLVQLYLFFGFGAEARSVLQSFHRDSAEATLWRAMAAVIDGVDDPSTRNLARQSACPGHPALWASLASASVAQIDPAVRPGIAASFSALPVHLRRHLGPGLAEKFLAVGDISTAQAVRDAVWRAPGDAGLAARVTEGHLDAARGNLGDAEVSFADVASTGGPETANALAALVDAQVGRDKPVDPATATAIAALIRGQRGTPAEPKLRRAEMLARASGGDFDTAFALGQDGDPEATEDVWALLARSGTDTAVLTHAVIDADATVLLSDVGTRNRIGQRLFDLGFADVALQWLALDETGMVLAARARLKTGDARAALRDIAGLSTPEADQLRGEALSKLGDAPGAAAAFAASGDAKARSDSLWRGQDWAGAAPTRPEADRRAVDVLSSPAPASADQTAPLAQGRALLADSANARTAIAALLGAAPPPAGP